MCETCRATGVLLLAKAQQEIILAEAEDGNGYADADRPLSDFEKQSGVNFGAIGDLHDETDEQVRRIIEHLQRDIGDELTDTPYAAIAALGIEPTQKLLDALSKAIDELTDALSAAWVQSGELLLDEAQRLGSRRARAVSVPEPDTGLLFRYATTAAQYQWNATVWAATRDLDLTQDGKLSADEAQTVIDAVGIDGAVDQGKQGGNAAIAGGRHETMRELTPVRCVASEILDGATCDRCRAIDGKVWDTLEEALEWYPTAGYVNCRGGARCRGILITDEYEE